ncbi:Methionine aminopeptidase [Buchnera aphidicola (Tetraneura ulmi)]|uniref:type I methionyl aminopeptidase n=1 Tax=Buchnera aphidicola TaxID=9 RepID=UPI0034649CD4
MKIHIKNQEEIKKIKISSKLASEVLEMISEYMTVNTNLEKINKICHKHIIEKQNAIPACLGYRGYPKSICISINDVVCHGIPNKKQYLKEGDIANVDITILKNGYYGDTSKMFFIGKIKETAKKLCEITKKSLYLTFKKIKPGIPINIIGKTIEQETKKSGFSIVKEYCGHGIGKNFHEEPQILHYYNRYQNTLLQENMVFTIEPMINEGKSYVKLMKDNWTVKTQDKSLSAQYEHTILVTKTGCKILTKRKKEKIPYEFNNI